jgi:SAM-dependent methyltransferase
VEKNLKTIINENCEREICLDVGCGTGSVTDFELPLYTNVVALDISSSMIRVIKEKISDSGCLNLVMGDAENLPFRQSFADLVSISSVLHHVPRPFQVISNVSRILRKRGIIYITREPNIKKNRKYFEFIDHDVIHKIALLINKNNTRIYSEGFVSADGLNYDAVDIHYPRGLRLKEITTFLESKYYKIISAYSYHWIYSDYKLKTTRDSISKINFLVEKLPFTDKLGRYINVVARKIDF